MYCDTMEPCRKGQWSDLGTGSWICTGSLIDAGNKCYLFKSVIFHKATNAAGQGRLSKFEAVECSEIGYS